MPAVQHVRFSSLNVVGSYTGPQCNASQTRRRRKRTLAPLSSSQALHCKLSDDMRSSPGCPRIEKNDAVADEQTTWRLRCMSASSWHWKESLRQRPMPTLMLQNFSKHGDQCAPARRQSGRRKFDHLPPPRTCAVRLQAPATRCCTCCRSAAALSATPCIHDG